MKKVLVIITTSFVRVGGLTNSYLNYYREIDKEKFKIDFASTNNIETSLYDEIKVNNGYYYCLGNRKRNPLAYYNKLIKVLKKSDYDIVHIHGNSATMIIETMACRMTRIKKIIVQVHAVESDYRFLDYMLKPMFNHTYHIPLSVSQQAGERLFNKSFSVLNNAIDLTKYQYNEQIGKNLRHKFELDNYFIIGNVGKLTKLKNQAYLIDVLYELKKEKSRLVKLVIVGDGPERKTLTEKIKKLNLSKDVILLGMREDVADLMNVFDVFVFPSIREGLGMVLIEAQANGLTCIASDTLPKETRVTNNIIYLPIDPDCRNWCERIEHSNKYNRVKQSGLACESISNGGYSIKSQVKKLEELYDK